MGRADWERAAAIYFPLVAAILARLINGRRARQFAACLLSLLWTAPALLVLQRWNVHATWWSFAPSLGPSLRGMPLELFVGWMILWGLVPQLALPRLGVVWSVVVMVGVDCMLMPLSSAAIHLNPNWLVGEAAGVALVLIPALCLAQWTRNDTNLRGRAVLQIATSGLLFLFLIPEIIFALRPGTGWYALLGLPSWRLQISLQIVLILALPGVAAVMEFAERGLGTPIPYDPPRRLVKSGIYRYCANPMQLSCGLVMLTWAGLLRSGWMLMAACLSIVYSAGIAEWDEGEDLADRFGSEWSRYRSEVRSWWPRWRPYCAGPPALIYIARSCGPCSEVRRWLERRSPIGLRVVDAETLPAGSIHRMRYDPGDGTDTVDGVRAMGRALEHLHLGWTLVGAASRLPVLWRMVQVLLDACGLGPRDIATQSCSLRVSEPSKTRRPTGTAGTKG